MKETPIASAWSDSFVGKRSRLKRYLVCSMNGYFPVAVQTGPDSLAAVVRTEAPHIGIMGALAVTTSADGGRSWSDLVPVRPRGRDVRNPAFGANGRSQLIVAYWEAAVQHYEQDEEGLDWRYVAHIREGQQEAPAVFTCVSADGGCTWGEPRPYVSGLLTLASPYGRIISAADGALYLPLYGYARQGSSATEELSLLVRSPDDGESWGDESPVARGYNETSFAFLPDGALVAAARSTSGHVAILHSTDQGRTWSDPVQVTRDGEHPADLTVLQSGQLLLTFGRRIRPLGCGALLSADGGRTWRREREVLLAGDGIENQDLGYPSTVQLADGHIVTLLYFASGCDPSEDWHGWGKVSCQAIHYQEQDIA